MKYSILIIISTFLLLGNLASQTDTTNLTITLFERIPSNIQVNKTYIDNKNLIWLSTNNGLYETSGDGSKLVHHLNGISIFDFVKDRSDNKWAAGKSVIYNITNNKSFDLPIPSVQIRDIEYYNGELWIGTDQGIFTLNPNQGKFTHLTTKNSKLDNNQINFLHADKEKVMWIGTNSGYLRIEKGKWSLNDKDIKMLATCENSEGQWIITQRDMFLINKFNRLFPVKLEPNQFEGNINEFVVDSKGRIYIASNVLVRYDPYTEKIEKFDADAGMLSKAAISLACDKNDNIWIGTGGAGFYKLLFGDIALEQLSAALIIEKGITCQNANNASIRAITSGGTKPFTYQWEGFTSEINVLQNLQPGTYTVTVTDKFNTTASATIVIENPLPISIEISSSTRVSSPTAQDGSATIVASGGTGNLKYLWSNGQKTNTLTKVNSGIYFVTVSDANGCQDFIEVDIKKEKFIPDLDIKKIAVGQTLRINELNFEADSSRITASNYEVLEEVFEFLVYNSNIKIEIGGHTNTVPPHEYCDKLSSDRARNVAEYLFKKGINQDRIEHKGYGKRQPITESESALGRQRNQRVEIKILDL